MLPGVADNISALLRREPRISSNQKLEGRSAELSILEMFDT